MEQLELRWNGHACFSLTCRGFTVVFDPYEDNYVPGFAPLDLEADLVLCSHGHGDHSAAHVVKLRTGRDNPFTITTIDTFHDPEGGALRGTNTIHILEAGGLKAAHFGDIGCQLTPTQLAELQGLDVAMIPVGGFYTIGPEEAKALTGKDSLVVVVDTSRPEQVRENVRITEFAPLSDEEIQAIEDILNRNEATI